jgi:hypothetical protein
VPTGQLDAHTPEVQRSPSAHASPHAPQLASSALRSTHSPAHDISPPEQSASVSVPVPLEVPLHATANASAEKKPATYTPIDFIGAVVS